MRTTSSRRRARAVAFVDLGSRQDAEPLLFIHGWGVSTSAFAEFLEHVAGNYRVIAPDLPGFGGSARIRRPTCYTAFADALAGLLDDLGIASAHVAGISMGGGIALKFAARHPRYVRSLVLMSPTGCPPTSFAGLAFNRVAELTGQLTSRAHGRGKGRVVRSFVGNLLTHPAAMASSLRMLASESILEDAARISVPTLLLWGDRDRTIPVRLAREFARRLPNARLEVMADTYHEMATARPERTAQTIHDFIIRRG